MLYFFLRCAQFIIDYELFQIMVVYQLTFNACNENEKKKSIFTCRDKYIYIVVPGLFTPHRSTEEGYGSN